MVYELWLMIYDKRLIMTHDSWLQTWSRLSHASQSRWSRRLKVRIHVHAYEQQLTLVTFPGRRPTWTMLHSRGWEGASAVDLLELATLNSTSLFRNALSDNETNVFPVSPAWRGFCSTGIFSHSWPSTHPHKKPHRREKQNNWAEIKRGRVEWGGRRCEMDNQRWLGGIRRLLIMKELDIGKNNYARELDRTSRVGTFSNPVRFQ